MSNAKIEWMILSFCPPGKVEEPAAIIVVAGPDFLVKCKPKLFSSDDEDIQTVWEGMVQDFQDKTMGYQAVEILELAGSHNFRVSNRKFFDTRDLGLDQALNVLFSKYVEQKSN